MKRKCYPRSTDPMAHLGGKVQVCIIDCMDEIATQDVRTRSEIHRQLLIEALRARGLCATAEEMTKAAA